MKSFNITAIFASLLFFAGCETFDENYEWAKANEDRIKEVIELIKEIPFSPASELAAENEPKAFVPVGTVTVDIPPHLEVYATISGDLLESSIRQIFPAAQMDTLADDTFAILTLESIEEFIPWSQVFAKQIGFVYGSEVLDCDNFARGFRGAVKYALSQSARIEAEALCATVWVRNATTWAGVSDGYHALNAMPYYSKNEDKYGILVVEPQNGVYTDLSLYPNRKNIYRITVSGG